MKKRTKRGRVQDRKRIALTQAHERNYLVRKAKELMELCKTDIKRSRKEFNMKSGFELFAEKGTTHFSTRTTARICKALIKCLKKL